MGRTPDLLDLSALGLNPISLADALAYPDRARKVRLETADKALLKLRRVVKLNLGPVEPPPWLGELRHLRMIQGRRLTGEFPRSLLALPHLTFVHFDDSQLASVDGIEQMRALRALTIVRTPARENLAALEAVAAKIPNARAGGMGIEVKRTAGKPPRDIAKAINADELDDWSELHGVDLAGATFEDAYITHDFTGAKLANTTWRRCDFEYAKLADADLTGATFEDCYFGSVYDGKGTFGGATAVGATFLRCGGDFEIRGADITNARFLDTWSDTRFFMDKAKARGIELHTSFCTEKEHQFTAKGADLRGARVYFDITPERRAEIAAKPKSRYAWKQTHFDGAKTDKTTVVEYAPLGAPPPTKTKSLVDPEGPKAKALGQLHASNASLWFVAFDAAEAAQWRGSVSDEDPKDDFQRALAIEGGPITANKAKGVVAPVGDNGWAHVWAVDGGIALVDCSIQLDDKAAAETALALRVAQWKPKKKLKVGKLAVKSGALALMLPYRDGKLTAKQLAKAKTSVVEDADHDRIVVPVKNGTYEVLLHIFGPTPNYEDEAGRYETCVRIVKAK